MSIFKKKIVLGFFIIFITAYQLPVIYAVEESISIKNETINPGSFYYPLKRLWEKGREKLLFNAKSRVSFHQSQLRTRLGELNYVVENKLLSELQTSSQRFAYEAGILKEELVKGNQDKEKVIKEFEQMQRFLDKLRDNYPANTSFWMLIQHDINTLSILSDQLK